MWWWWWWLTLARAKHTVEATATRLNSGDCFVLVTDDRAVVWHGAGASDAEVESATAIGNILNGKREVTDIKEGEEDDAFWAALGGQGEH